jgi:phosphatidylglycerol lysyltransferase
MRKVLIHSLGPLLSLLLFSAAVWVLHRQLRAYHFTDILDHLHAVPFDHLLLAILLTTMNYLVMTGYDTLALRYVQHPLTYGKIALTSFIAYAFSNNIGLSMLAGASVRYRLYSAWGLTAFEVTKVVAFCTMTLWLGFFTVSGLVFSFESLTIPKALNLPFMTVQPIGVILIGVVGAYLLVSGLRKRPIRIREWEFPLPSVRLSLIQIGVACLDWIMAGTVLYALMPQSLALSFPAFIGIYMLAQLAGMISQIPGGLGVFEMVALLLLSPFLPRSQVFGILLVYRAIYYLLPLGAAAILLGMQEVFQKKERLRRFVQIFGEWISGITPHVLSFAVFVGGAILLFSGAAPPVAWRLKWLSRFLPLPVVELSHFLGSLIGTALLLLARGLQRRLDGAYVLTVVLLYGGILFSLLKGLDYEEAIIMCIILAILIPCRRHFYRKALLMDQPFRPGWIASIVVVLVGSIWLGFFSSKHVEYSSDLWWRFTLFGHAPRFLRATVGAIALILALAIAKLLRPAPPRVSMARMEDFDRILNIVRASPKAYANLALLGDKRFLFSSEENAFIMYGVEGRSWIAMGDPVGREEAWSELAWQFREMCDRYEGWPVFYEVEPEKLHLYLDLGLTLIKLGEEARIPLDSFSLEGSAHKGLRHTYNKLRKEGLDFEIESPEQFPSLLPELKVVSDAWLDEKHTREKKFSLGFFDAEYLKWFPIGIIRKEGKILAFTNLWQGANGSELSIDLMRYRPDAPYGVMDYLLMQIMLWGREKRFRWFNLGMAPLSGLGGHELAPLWNRLGTFVFRHGEHFYNLQGLRQYKEKFDPDWKPKYLASPGGLSTPKILVNIASIISGGFKGVITK